MENENKNIKTKEKFVDKSVHQTYNGGKPVGYGSSIQNSGNGNRTRPHDQDQQDEHLRQSAKEKEQ